VFLPGRAAGSRASTVSADGRTLAVLGADQTLRLCDVASRTQLADAIPSGLQGGGVAVSDDGLEVPVTTDQGLIRWISTGITGSSRPAVLPAGN
jgi:hypothetical protein